MSAISRPKKVPNEIDKAIGKRIRLRRVDLGLNQQQLGDSIGVSYQQVQKYENGTDRVGASRLYAIARALNVEITFFFEPRMAAGEQVGGIAGSVPGMNSDQSAKLLSAFAGIQDGDLRTKIVELVTLVSRATSANRHDTQ